MSLTGKQYVLSIDPGLSSGVALLSYEEDSPAELVKAWQFTGGVSGLIPWIRENWRESGWDSYNDEPLYPGLYWTVGVDEWLNTEETTAYDPQAAEEERWDDYEVDDPANPGKQKIVETGPPLCDRAHGAVVYPWDLQRFIDERPIID